MTLEILTKRWAVEARAHGYIGFLVVNNPKRALDRIFLKESSELETALENCEDNSIEVISEVWL